MPSLKRPLSFSAVAERLLTGCTQDTVTGSSFKTLLVRGSYCHSITLQARGSLNSSRLSQSARLFGLLVCKRPEDHIYDLPVFSSRPLMSLVVIRKAPINFTEIIGISCYFQPQFKSHCAFSRTLRTHAAPQLQGSCCYSREWNGRVKQVDIRGLCSLEPSLACVNSASEDAGSSAQEVERVISSVNEKADGTEPKVLTKSSQDSPVALCVHEADIAASRQNAKHGAFLPDASDSVDIGDKKRDDDEDGDVLEYQRSRSRKNLGDAISSGRVRRSRPVPTRLPDLLAVPGIGPRNLEKLVAKGIGKIEELKRVYREKFLDDGSAKMVEYLQSSVGILHKNHAERITAFIKESVDEELKAKDDQQQQNIAKQKKRLTFCVEGNISVGKTTFLHKIANETIELRDLVEIVPEPVGKWKDVGPEHFNLLDAFYAEPQRYAYTFQNYVFATRLMQEQESARGLKPLRLMERSIFSDRMVFVRAVHEAKWMNELELSIYDSWFDPFVSALPGLVPDAFIYLRASPDTCHRRLQMRNRPEEQGVTLEYLRNLHEKHEQWLFPAENTCGGVLSVTQWPSGLYEPPPPRIRDRVFYLEGDHLHSCIRKVPALVLDCEAMIDFSKDIEAKIEYARQVSEFVDYVERTKKLEANQNSSNAKAFDNLILPQAHTLLGQSRSILQSHAFSSINLRQHSSSFVNK